jgi:hypothetical protein
VDEWMDRCINRSIERHRGINGWTVRRIYKYIEGLMDGCKDGWIGGYIDR